MSLFEFNGLTTMIITGLCLLFLIGFSFYVGYTKGEKHILNRYDKYLKEPIKESVKANFITLDKEEKK